METKTNIHMCILAVCVFNYIVSVYIILYYMYYIVSLIIWYLCHDFLDRRSSWRNRFPQTKILGGE